MNKKKEVLERLIFLASPLQENSVIKPVEVENVHQLKIKAHKFLKEMAEIKLRNDY